MASNPVVFLDIDGVLNHNHLYELMKKTPGNKPVDWLDRDCVSRINTVCTRTGALVVVISGWIKTHPNEYDGTVADLLEAGLGNVVIGHAATSCPEGIGPLEYQYRWYLISQWLEHNREVVDWVIIDDVNWSGYPSERFVQTSIETGITDNDIEKAVSIIKGRMTNARE